MRILFIYRYFWPDTTPYASMLRTIGGHLVQEGHTVHLWTEMPTYQKDELDDIDPPARDLVEGVEVTRFGRLPLWKRSKIIRRLDMVAFPLRVFLYALKKMLGKSYYDYVVTATIPPVINGLSGVASSKLLRAEFIYHLQDIYPEVGATTGFWKKGGLIERTLLRIDSYSCSAAYKNVVLSHDMANTLNGRNLNSLSVEVINNFLLESFGQSDLTKYRADTGNIRVTEAIFAGNLGRFQGLELIVEAICTLDENLPFRMTFLGDGVMEEKLKKLAKGNTKIRFLPRVSFDEAQRIIASSDFGVVALESEVFRFAYPSKTLTYLGLGLPILLIVEQCSVMAKELTAEGVCVCPKHRSAEEIAKSIETFCDSRENRLAMKEKVTATYSAKYSREIVLKKWSSLFV